MHIITDESAGQTELTPLEKGKAMLHHMIHHNEQHLEEFVSLKETMSKEGQTDAAAELSDAIRLTEEALTHLRNAYDAVADGGIKRCV